jgi:hypothetical protein
MAQPVTEVPRSGSLALLLGVLLCSVLAATGARADQLIQIPTADRASGPELEYLHRVSGADEGYGTLFAPVGTAYELMARYYNNLDHSHNIEVGGMFQLLPDGVVTPGIALGLWDVTDSTPWGRRAFFVITKSLKQGQFLIPKPIQRVQFTFGAGTGRFGGVLAGARVDLPVHVSLVSEYDARRLNVGLWYTPARAVSLKAELQNGNPYVGGELRARF